MPKLKFFVQGEKYVIQRTTEFGHVTNRYFDSIKEVQKEILYMPSHALKDYEIEIEQDVGLLNPVTEALTIWHRANPKPPYGLLPLDERG